MKISPKQLLKVVVIFLLLILLINILFTLFWSIYNGDFTDFWRAIIPISMYTIGYDIPNNVSLILVFIQALLGVCFIAYFSAFLTFQLFKRENIYLFPKLYLFYDNDSYYLILLVGNGGKKIYDINGSLQFTSDKTNEPYYTINYANPVVLNKTLWSNIIPLTKDSPIYAYLENHYNFLAELNLHFLFKCIDSDTGLQFMFHKQYGENDLCFIDKELFDQIDKKKFTKSLYHTLKNDINGQKKLYRLYRAKTKNFRIK